MNTRVSFCLLAACCMLCTPTFALDIVNLKILLNQAGVSSEDLRDLGDGFIAREMDVKERAWDLTMLGVMRVDTTAERMQNAIGRVDAALRTIDEVSIRALNVIAEPAREDEFETYRFTEAEKKALGSCEVGDCRMKLPTNLIDSLDAFDYQWKRDAETFTQDYRGALVKMVRSYQSWGNAGLWVYRDKPTPLHAGDGYRQALTQASGTLRLVPEVVNYLADYPNYAIEGAVEEFLYWSVLDFGHRPTLTINHAVSLRPANPEIDWLVADKTIYANHYFGGRASFVALVAGDALSAPGTYFVVSDHMRFDGKMNRILRAVVSRGIVADLENRLRFLRALAESGS